MRTYYRGPDAVITDTHFVWQSPTVRIFAIDDLRDVRLVRVVAGGPSVVAVAEVWQHSQTRTLTGSSAACIRDESKLVKRSVMTAPWGSFVVSMSRPSSHTSPRRLSGISKSVANPCCVCVRSR